MHTHWQGSWFPRLTFARNTRIRGSNTSRTHFCKVNDDYIKSFEFLHANLTKTQCKGRL